MENTCWKFLAKTPGSKPAIAEGAVQERQPEQIVGELFAEELFTAPVAEGRQHVGLQQLFGWNAGTSELFAELREEEESFYKIAFTWRLMARRGRSAGSQALRLRNGEKHRPDLKFTAGAF